MFPAQQVQNSIAVSKCQHLQPACIHYGSALSVLGLGQHSPGKVPLQVPSSED